MTFRNHTTWHRILLKWFYNVLNNKVSAKTMVIAPKMTEFSSSTNTLHSFCNKLTWSKQLFAIDFFCPALWDIWDMDCAKLEDVVVDKVLFFFQICLSYSGVTLVIVSVCWCVGEAWKNSSQNSYSTVHSKAAGFHLGKKQHWNTWGDDNTSLYAYKLTIVSSSNAKQRQCWAHSKHT